MTGPAQLIDAPGAWRDVAPAIAAAPRLGLDLEADGFHRYPERISLVQIATPDGAILLVDTLAVDDLSPLDEVLADASVEKVFHSADYDLRSLDRDYGVHVGGLFDTAIAAQFCGARRTGLGNVLSAYLGVEVQKSKQLQRLDWSRRPLADSALAYAADDVAYLLRLADVLATRLAELGRTEWAAEECRRLETVRYHTPEPPDRAYLGVPGARDLSDAERAVLRELYIWREGEARRTGRPPYMLISNRGLLALAERPDPSAVSQVNRGWLAGAREGLAAALERGLAAPPARWPRRPRGDDWPPMASSRLRRLKSWRTDQADALDLDPGVVWPADHLKRVALHPEADSRALDEGDPAWVRQWQWRTLGDSLERLRHEMGDDRRAAAR